MYTHTLRISHSLPCIHSYPNADLSTLDMHGWIFQEIDFSREPLKRWNKYNFQGRQRNNSIHNKILMMLLWMLCFFFPVTGATFWGCKYPLGICEYKIRHELFYGVFYSRWLDLFSSFVGMLKNSNMKFADLFFLKVLLQMTFETGALLMCWTIQQMCPLKCLEVCLPLLSSPSPPSSFSLFPSFTLFPLLFPALSLSLPSTSQLLLW